MDIWSDVIYPKLLELMAADEIYQNRLEQCRISEKSFLKVADSLSIAQRKIIEDYMVSCDNLEFRMTQLAAFLNYDDETALPK
ncbi:MAG: hypothetical protein E7456_06700 [Ruminococcaceae bacterium]|nr:hypothetical protein [Oscillospiraceae bacterium]